MFHFNDKHCFYFIEFLIFCLYLLKLSMIICLLKITQQIIYLVGFIDSQIHGGKLFMLEHYLKMKFFCMQIVKINLSESA